MARKILVAIDGSDTGGRALSRAAELSKKLGCDLSIVHVLMHGRPSAEMLRLAESEHLIEEPDKAQYFESLKVPQHVREFVPSADEEMRRSKATVAVGEYVLETAKRRAKEEGAHNVTTRLCAGDYADEILDAAEYDEVDMIVLGRRGLGRVRGALLGSVSQKVLHHAPCTVVIVN